MCNKRTNQYGQEEFFDGEFWMGERDVCNVCRDQREADGQQYKFADERTSFGCYAGRYCDECWSISGYRDACDPQAEWSAADCGEAMYEDEY